MLSFQDYEKCVYDAFMKRRQIDNRFNFSVRQKASKGAEKNYFIGTEKGKYFGTTFWQIAVGFPGSAGDLINVFFLSTSDSKLKYYFEFNQTNNPDNDQNKWALELIKNLEPIIEEIVGLSKKSNPSQKICNFKTKSRQATYSDINNMMNDVFEDAKTIIPIVNQEIAKIKSRYPQFVAHQITGQEFDQMQKKLLTRQGKIPSIDQSSNSVREIPRSSNPHNQILFGPPGTGKTYHTIDEALKIVGIDVSGLTRTQIKEEFDKKLKEGQIVFTTFHQSMSYEEFIEGIKPIEPEKDGDDVIYRVEPGLFKKLSIEASFDIAKFRRSRETADALDFSNLYDLFIEGVQEKLINEEEVELKTKNGGTVLIDSISQQGNIIIKHHNGTRSYTVSKARLTKLQAAFDSLDSVSNINDEFREVIGGSNSSAYWSVSIPE
jgi:hypothetical protein